MDDNQDDFLSTHSIKQDIIQLERRPSVMSFISLFENPSPAIKTTRSVSTFESEPIRDFYLKTLNNTSRLASERNNYYQVTRDNNISNSYKRDSDTDDYDDDDNAIYYPDNVVDDNEFVEETKNPTISNTNSANFYLLSLKKSIALKNLSNSTSLEVAEVATMNKMQTCIIEDLDTSEIAGYVIIPDNIPQWKREHLERKNREAINSYLKLKEEQEIERQKYGNIPQWKKDLLMKKEKEKSEKVQEDSHDKFGNIPQWKKEILSKKQQPTSPTKP